MILGVKLRGENLIVSAASAATTCLSLSHATKHKSTKRTERGGEEYEIDGNPHHKCWSQSAISGLMSHDSGGEVK